MSVIKPKGKSQNGCFKKRKHPKFSEKRSFLTPYERVSAGKKCSFFGKFPVLCFLETPVLRFAFLPYYRRVVYMPIWQLFIQLSKIDVFGYAITSNILFTIDTLKETIFEENYYPENFIDRCFKLFLNKINTLKESVSIVEKKPLRLILSFLDTALVHTRTKLQKSIKEINSYCKLPIGFKDNVPQTPRSCAVCKF